MSAHQRTHHSVVAAVGAAVMIVLGLWLPPADADEPEPIWSADMTVSELSSSIIGATTTASFANIGGSGDLQIVSLWAYRPNSDLRLRFAGPVANASSYALQVGELSMRFPRGSSGASRFTWTGVTVDWVDGQVVHVRVMPSEEVVIAEENNPASGQPTISGTAEVGQPLTADISGIADADGLSGVTYNYQWLADDAEISGATDSSYTLTSSEQGKTIKVRVDFTDNARQAESLTSAATAAVAARPNRPATGQPAISGTALEGEQLTASTSAIADADGLSGVRFSYQWLADDTEIAGATGARYTLTYGEVGKAIKVRVGFTDNADYDESLTSEATVAVAATVLSGTFIDLPDSHNGSDAFSFRLELSEPVATSYVTFRYSAFTVTGGEIKSASRVERRSDLWLIVVEPFHGSHVTVSLPVTTNCADSGAVCAANGKMLTSGDRAFVPGPAPLTASLRDVPQSHNGRDAFSFQLTFSEPVTTSYQSLEDDAMTVTGGDLTSASRVDVRSDLWRITVAPDGRGSVSVTLPVTADCHDPGAVCTAAGKKLSSGARLLVAGPSSTDNNLATGAPTIEGTPRVGSTLTANVSGIADADGLTNPDYSYQWLADDTDVAGATSDRFTLTTAELGKAIKVRVSFSDDAENEETLTSAATAAVTSRPAGAGSLTGSANSPPTGWPTIKGLARVGKRLTVDTLGIDDADGLTAVAYVYQWIRTDAGVDAEIGGAVEASYTLTDDDLGKTLKVTLTFDDDAGNSETLTSDSTAVVQQKVSGAPTLVSNLLVGSGSAGIQRAVDVARAGVAQAFTTGTHSGGYLLGSVGIQVTHFYNDATVGDHIQATIHEVRNGEPGDTICTLIHPSSFSTPGLIRFQAPTGDDSCPKLKAQTSYFLVVEWPNLSSNVRFAFIPQTYPSRRSPATAEDPGATEGWSIADRSHYLQLNLGYRDWMVYEQKASFKIDVRGAESTDNNPATGLPTINGALQVGEELTAEISAIADADGLDEVDYSYQWLLNDGVGDAEIAGATGPSYVLRPEDAGKTIKVRVSFFDNAENRETLTSEPTVEVEAIEPGAPQDVQVTVVDANTLDVTWQAPSSDGGSEVTGYRLQWKESTADWDTPEDVSEEDATGLSHTIPGLTEHTEYAVRVLASNEAGASQPSAEILATPIETIPPDLLTASINGADLTLVYDEDLDENAVPPADAFSVTVGGVDVIIDAVSIAASDVTLSLVSAVTVDDEVTVSYTAPPAEAAERIQDLAGNAAASFTAQQTSNATPEPDDGSFWSAMLTVGLTQGQYGYSSIASLGQISRTTFSLDESVYTVEAATLYQDLVGISLDRSLPGGFMLRVGATEFASKDATTVDAGVLFVYLWPQGDLSWSDGQRVRLKLFPAQDESQTQDPDPAEVDHPPLTASVHELPASHDGASVFTFELHFSEEFGLSFSVLRDHAFTVTGGTVTRATRKEPGQNIKRIIHIQPDGDDPVTVVLPVTTDCNASGAICNGERMLSSRIEFTINGPAAEPVDPVPLAR